VASAKQLLTEARIGVVDDNEINRQSFIFGLSLNSHHCPQRVLWTVLNGPLEYLIV
jgi:hypothetical protein